jgi:RNase H-fold protein (predicted Holliday junction resolvase)
MSTSIREDKSYLSGIDLLSIDKGVAVLGIHSIRIDVELTGEQKQENRRLFETLTPEDWSKRCDSLKVEKGDKVEKVIDVIAANFMIYQYKDEEKKISYSMDNWDLFFWCNGADMSYVTLNPNKARSNEQQIADINKVLDLIKTIECDGIGVAIQYTVQYDLEKVNVIRDEQYQKLGNKLIEFQGYTGRIKEVGKTAEGKVVFGFFKKGASKKYQQVSDSTFLQMAFNC